MVLSLQAVGKDRTIWVVDSSAERLGSSICTLSDLVGSLLLIANSWAMSWQVAACTWLPHMCS